MKLNVNNETSKLLSVVLGIAESVGPVPKSEECYDPKSRQHVQNKTYPKEIDMLLEMESFANILMKHNLKLDNLDGMKFNIVKDEWSLSEDKSINYIGKFIKN